MSKGPRATIKPALLVWARETAGYDLLTAAQKLGVEEVKIVAWESGEDQPSIPQLRKLAELYKRPLAVFYLSAPPLTFQPMHDFRRLPDFGGRHFSPELTLEIRSAQQRRELALELIDDADGAPQRFELSTSIKEDPEKVGAFVRGALGIDYQLQARWRDPRVAFHAWRSRVEDKGVLVFQASRVESSEASGFAVWADVLPVIVVNRKDVYPRRVFSLLHELTHLMLHQSGVSDLDANGARPIDDERLEMFCNHVAGAALVPEDLLLGETIVLERGFGRHEWSDPEIKSLALTYSVSRETIVRRLLTLRRATEDFYGRKRQQYALEYQQQREREKEKNAGKEIPRNMPLETVANVGKPFARWVIENYRQDRISLSEVSGYLGVKVRHVPGIERQLDF
ncbi:XRE family transcriptional regulator [Pleomorphomonas sp. NRK KF1]|uniref:XRE family transcriptional regulator n=1 Tax=Pleomorphomonas sp. NRK KF1 TaxID=2943000 RepID=UPI002044BF3C|nr:XRE family transcriptional regulator [Pleomorphomonas sp. NRK KF1]MCM5555320.1 XRE family transcriptional regulator [Pleomorphomonas sp. NRK KF1]